MSNHLFKDTPLTATNVDSIAAVAYGRWLAEGRAVDSVRSADGSWTHKAVAR